MKKIISLVFFLGFGLAMGITDADFTFSTSTNFRSAVNSFDTGSASNFSAKGLELFFGSPRPGEYGDADLWRDSITPVVDFNGDGRVDLIDFSILAQYWHQSELSVDIAPPPLGDGMIDFKDLTALTEYWLEGFGLVAHWRLDETEGSIAADSAGDHDGIVHNATWTEGMIGGALDLNGFNSYVDCGDSELLGPEYMTLAMWLQPRHMGGTRYIVSRAHLVSDAMDYAIKWHYGGQIEFVLAQDQGDPVSIISSTKVSLDVWSHIAVTCDGEQMFVYINGELDSSAFYSSRPVRLEHRFIMGSLRGETRFYNGKIDDVRLYNHVLSEEQIAELAGRSD